MIFAPALTAAFLIAMSQQKLLYGNNELRTFGFLHSPFSHALFSLHIKHNTGQHIAQDRPVMPFIKLKRHYLNLLSNGWHSEWKQLLLSASHYTFRYTICSPGTLAPVSFASCSWAWATTLFMYWFVFRPSLLRSYRVRKFSMPKIRVVTGGTKTKIHCQETILVYGRCVLAVLRTITVDLTKFGNQKATKVSEKSCIFY